MDKQAGVEVAMQMTLDEYAARFPDRPPPVPERYAGQWVAWNADCTEIISNGDNYSEVFDQAIASGCLHPVLQRIPRGPFIGGT